MAKNSGVILVQRIGGRTIEQITAGEMSRRSLCPLGMPSIIERKHKSYDFYDFVNFPLLELEPDEIMVGAVAYVAGISRTSPHLMDVARDIFAKKKTLKDVSVDYFIPVQFYAGRRK